MYRALCVGLVVAASLGCFRKRDDDASSSNSTTNSSTGGSSVSSGTAGSGGSGGSGGAPVVQWDLKDSSTTVDLYGVWIDDAGATAFAVGAAGTIVRSDDGGESWQALNSNVSDDLFGVFGIGTEIYAVGENGVILHSTDGMQFSPEDSQTGVGLHSVWASDPMRVFVGGAGSLMLRSIDGGTTWVPRPNAASTTITGIWGLDADTVYAVTEASLITTIDGGDQWSYEILSINAHTDVWVGAGGHIFITNDGGVVTSWETDHWLKTVFGANSAMYGIWGASVNDLYIVGQWGLIARTGDAGVNWLSEDAGSEATLRAVHGGGGKVLAVGDGGVILRRP